MRHISLGLALALGALSVTTALSVTSARADASLRCGTRLANVGDAPYQVKSLCGAPDDVQQRTEVRAVRRAVTLPCRAGYCQAFVEDSIQVTVEEWTYDFGPQRFVQFLTFENGRLVRVRSGNYGRKLPPD